LITHGKKSNGSDGENRGGRLSVVFKHLLLRGHRHGEQTTDELDRVRVSIRDDVVRVALFLHRFYKLVRETREEFGIELWRRFGFANRIERKVDGIRTTTTTTTTTKASAQRFSLLRRRREHVHHRFKRLFDVEYDWFLPGV
jgi:hypothetical protein